MKNKHCEWCDHQFDTDISYQKYCSAECREAATKEKIAARYLLTRIKNRVNKNRKCKTCGAALSVYNDSNFCRVCSINTDDVTKILKQIKGIINGKEIPED